MNPLFRSWKVLVGLAGLVYLLLLNNSDVGFFGDDAVYILGAKSLLQGRYVSLAHLNTPALTQFPPGYSLFLAPWVRLVDPHWFLLEISSLLLLLLALRLAWALFDGWLPPGRRWLACGLLAFNQLTLIFSNAVMSEPLYLVLTLTIFILLRKTLAKDAPIWLPWLLGAIMGYTAIVRTIGIILLPSVGLSLICERRWRTLARVVPLAALPLAAFWIHNHVQARTVTAHFNLFQQMLPQLLSEGARWLDHLVRTGYMFFIYGTAQLRLPYNGWGIAFSVVLVALLASITIIGWKAHFKKGKIERAVAVGIGAYVASFFLVHAFWAAVDSRFVFPLLPFLIAYGVEGGYILCKKYAPSPLWTTALCASVIGVYLYQCGMLIRAWHMGGPRSHFLLPKTTFQWMAERLPQDARILSSRIPTVHLYTGRQGTHGIRTDDIEDFRYRLLSLGITHALFETGVPEVAVLGQITENQQNARWIRSWPEAFGVAYENPNERTIIYRVLPSSAFQQAYEMYLAARLDLTATDIRKGLAKLEMSLKRYPDLAVAHHAAGTAYLLEGRSLRKAEWHFQKALSIRPHYPQALLNLARLHRKNKNEALARAFYERALAAIPASGQSYALARLIQQEMASL